MYRRSVGCAGVVSSKEEVSSREEVSTMAALKNHTIQASLQVEVGYVVAQICTQNHKGSFLEGR